jgi:hypothetical protein
VTVAIVAFYLLLIVNHRHHDHAMDAPADIGIRSRKVLSTALSSQLNEKPVQPAITIPYLISITGCGSKLLAEGAAILKHSIHLASVHGNLGGHYNYKTYGIYHPEAASCVQPLEQVGYELVRRSTPVAVEDIQGKFLQRKIVQNGCCGEKELIKLEAYTFTEYPVAIHLDLDVLILKPLDDLFDAMILHDNSKAMSKVTVMWPDNPIPSKINAFFTRDYGMVSGGRKHKPVQKGFLVLRPDQSVYDKYVNIIKKGDFWEGSGW